MALAQGYYRFDLNFADPACPSGGDFALDVAAPGSGYVAGYSQIIPPAADASTAAFSVPVCPASLDDAIPAHGSALRSAAFGVRAGAAMRAAQRRHQLSRAHDSR